MAKQQHYTAPIEKEDYFEPNCPFCTDAFKNKEEANITRIQTDRVIYKLDEYLSKNDVEGAFRHLNYWLEEAVAGHDKRGELTVRNELMGLNRKEGKGDQAFLNAKRAAELVDILGIQNSVTAGTVFLNVATCFKAFGKAEEAVNIYEKALSAYNMNLKKGDLKFSGLYNNFALALVDVKEYDRAKEFYKKAIEITSDFKGSEPETAITYLNLADLAVERHGFEKAEQEINEYVEKAYALLNTEDRAEDGNYAYVCLKCAPVFGGFGYFVYEKTLSERAKRIYEGN